jgi:hypothetical protein
MSNPVTLKIGKLRPNKVHTILTGKPHSVPKCNGYISHKNPVSERFVVAVVPDGKQSPCVAVECIDIAMCEIAGGYAIYIEDYFSAWLFGQLDDAEDIRKKFLSGLPVLLRWERQPNSVVGRRPVAPSFLPEAK